MQREGATVPRRGRDRDSWSRLATEPGGLAPGETWLHLASGAGEPALNMAWDEGLLEGVARLGAPVLRFYAWSVPAATFGYAQRYADVERLTPLRPLIRRPTGGGVVPHDRDWTYTVVFPPSHGWYASRARESYERLHVWIQASLDRLGLGTALAATPAVGAPTHCFVRAEQFDVLWRGVKIAGAAQRRTRDGLLIQGSVQPPPGADREAWERSLLEQAVAAWGVSWRRLTPDAGLCARVEALACEKYAQSAYHQRR
jgi:lipoyl(octanoyl) transferase